MSIKQSMCRITQASCQVGCALIGKLELLAACAEKRQFNMGAYQKRYVALEVFYLGAAYHGFASQADTDRTVEVGHKGQCMLVRLGSESVTSSSRCLMPVSCAIKNDM